MDLGSSGSKWIWYITLGESLPWVILLTGVILPCVILHHPWRIFTLGHLINWGYPTLCYLAIPLVNPYLGSSYELGLSYPVLSCITPGQSLPWVHLAIWIIRLPWSPYLGFMVHLSLDPLASAPSTTAISLVWSQAWRLHKILTVESWEQCEWICN